MRVNKQNVRNYKKTVSTLSDSKLKTCIDLFYLKMSNEETIEKQ